MKAILALENGSIYEGRSCGVEGEKAGWVSFYTGVVGYQEVMSAPSNAGKIVVMTYPLIGNYGVAKKFMESGRCWVAGVVMKETSRIKSNWQAKGGLANFLKAQKVLAMDEVDTRTLMVELRGSGEQFGIISTMDFNPKSLKRKIERTRDKGSDVIKEISAKSVARLAVRGFVVAVIDIGVTNSLINQLDTLGCKVVLLPYNTGYDEILKLSPRGLIISDGPEMDKGIRVVVDTIKRLLGKFPIFGLGTGCQVLAMAMGAKLKPMHLGHHGLNYPVLKTGVLKGEITVQNHSYMIDEASLTRKDLEITWRNINDKTVEGIQNRELKAFGCQFYPASPGMGEVNPVLEEFIELTERNQKPVARNQKNF